MKKDAYGKKADDIDDLIEKLTGSEAFAKLQNTFLAEAEKLQKKLNEWKDRNTDKTTKITERVSKW